MNCRLRPLSNRIVVRLDEEMPTRPSTIILPDTVKDKEPVRTGRVLSVGPGFRTAKKPEERDPVEVSVGDHVVFGRYSGIDVEVDGEKLLIMEEREVFAVVA